MIVLAILVLVQITLGAPQLGCTFDITQLKSGPIIVDPNGYNFIYPNPSTGTVSIPAGQRIIISCPGNTLTLASEVSGTTVNATCISGSKFTANDHIFNFRQITCSNNAVNTARYTGKSCASNGKEAEIGFVLSPSSFARQIQICFDDTKKIALYSYHNITKSIGHHDVSYRPYFTEDNFYNLEVKVDELYGRTNQRKTINKLVGLSETSTKYIQDTNNYYLARGHLAAKADFVYDPQQKATFHFVNTVPHWQTFNVGNWKTAENNVRNYTKRRGRNLSVYTGTYGVTTLPHEKTGEDVPLYLFVGRYRPSYYYYLMAKWYKRRNFCFIIRTAIPVPKLFWKIVYDYERKLAVVLLGINNPYQQNVTKSIICQDVSSSISWLSWNATNLKDGYSYVCDYNDFKSKVVYAPRLEVTGLLR